MTWASWVDFVMGIWLIVSPFALGFRMMSGRAEVDDVVFGILIAAFSLWTAFKLTKFAGWLLGLFGLWILVAPFVLHTDSVARVTPNDMIVGIVVLCLAALRTTMGSRQPAKSTQTA
jgi:SPW repeat